MSSQRCLDSNNPSRWSYFVAIGAWGWVAGLLGACNPNDGCEVGGTCARDGSASVQPREAGVFEQNTWHSTTQSWSDAGGNVTSSAVGHAGDAGPRTTAPATSSADSSTSAAGPCDPVSERGCEGDKPWCLGEGEAWKDTEPEVPRCVACERDQDCQALSESHLRGVCLDYECTECEVGSNRGCSPDAPHCIFLGIDERTADAAVEHASGLVEDRAQVVEPQCVECLTEADCAEGTAACANHACVECDRDEQCTDPNAARCDTATNTCVGCNAAGQCSRFAPTPACDIGNGVCVECTREEQSKCDGQAPGGFDAACVTIPEHPDYFTCSDQRREYSTQCNECVSDAQCRAGFRCVPETYESPTGEVGVELATNKTYCMALESELAGDEACGDNRPFVGQFEATSEGGVTGVYCRPAYTTCTGYADWKTGPDAVADGDSGTKSTCTNHESCGIPGLDDAYCVEFTSTANRCTYACASDDDCPMPDSWCDRTNPPPGFNGSCSLKPN